LFEIDADPNVVTTKPFANICGVSKYVNEGEVLFMVGSVFRLTEIVREDEEQTWLIRMELCGDNQHELKQLFDHMKKSYGCGDKEINLHSLGNVLRNMGKYDLAERMYHRALDELSPTDPTRAGLYKSLGLVAKDKGELGCSLQWLYRSLEIKTQIDPHNYICIGNLYNWIGVIYERQGDNNRALNYFQRSIVLFQQANDEDHPSMAYFYNNSAIIYRRQERYEDALDLYKKVLNINQKHLPLDHRDVASAYNNIGVVYYHIGQYEEAMEHLQESLSIRLRSLPPYHQHIAESHQNIGRVYKANGEISNALEHYQKAIIIYRHSSASQHPDITQTEIDIQNLLCELI
jgi:tetratricopeptide (TPR) repeat protein